MNIFNNEGNQDSSGCVSLRTKNLAMKDCAALSLIHTRITSTVPKKFIYFQDAQSVIRTQPICAYHILCGLMLTTLVYIMDQRKTAWLLLVVVCLYFNYYVLPDLISFKECFYNCIFFLQVTPISNNSYFDSLSDLRVLTFWCALYSLG